MVWRENEKLVYERNQLLGRELVRTAWFETHFLLEDKLLSQRDAGDATLSVEEQQNRDSWEWVRESSRGLGAQFRHYAILPDNPKGKGRPTTDDEERLLREWSKVRPLFSEASVTEPVVTGVDAQLGAEPSAPSGESPVGLIESSLWEARTQTIEGVEKYLYYQPVYASRSCIDCHQVLGANPRQWVEGDLMAVMRIELDHESTRKDLAKNSGLMWGMAVTIGFLSMFLLYFIIRYIIVKPVQHLREVADAVREGNVEQRAEIHTGDEFEELAAAFNRMLRQLLRQQDALQQVNSRARWQGRRTGPGQHAAVRDEPPEERLSGHHEPRAAHAAQQHPRLQRRALRPSTRSTTSRSATSTTSSAPAGCCWR